MDNMPVEVTKTTKVTFSRIFSILLIVSSMVYAYETLIVNFNSLVFIYNGTNLNSFTSYLFASVALFTAGAMILITERIRAPLKRRTR